MPLTSTLLLLSILLPATAPAGVPAPGAGATPGAARFVFTGTVTQPGGRPVPGARVALEGAAGTTADAEGRYAFTHVVPVPAPAAGPAPAAAQRLVLRARHKGWHLALPSGVTALAIELRPIAAAADSVRIEVRSNDARVAKAVARAFEGGGDVVVELEARFTRLIGREDLATPELTVRESVAFAAPFPPAAAPAPAAAPGSEVPPAVDTAHVAAPGFAASLVAPPAIPAIPAAPVSPLSPAADTTLRPGFRVSVRPGVAPPPADTTAATAGPLRVALGRAVAVPEANGLRGCGCRVSGTVEVRSERPVRGRPRVVVSLAGLPAARDTVDIFMGPPRAFDLGRVPCGRHELEVRPLSSRRLLRVEPDSMGFECVANGPRWFRVVLEPR